MCTEYCQMVIPNRCLKLDWIIMGAILGYICINLIRFLLTLTIMMAVKSSKLASIWNNKRQNLFGTSKMMIIYLPCKLTLYLLAAQDSISVRLMMIKRLI